MSRLFETIYQITGNEDRVRERAYGVIEVVDSQLTGIHFRPFPKIISTVEAQWLGGWQHRRKKNNKCLIYYNQPVAHRNFLALKYIVTTLGTTYKTLYRATLVLDQIAEIKQTDAIVADVSNKRISERFLNRMGWQQHCQSGRGRNFIKRFYGLLPSRIPIANND